jgi:ABC-type nitrate/sulfonate/bicarbonate transport system permease component
MFSWNKRVTAPLFFVFCVFLLWQAIIYISQIPAWLLPSPARVAATFWDVLPLLIYHSQNTLLAAGSGLLAAVILALGLGIIMDFSPWVKQGIYPLIVLSQTIPIISIAPLLIIWLGFGLLPKMVVVALVCFFPVAVSTVEGMNAADPDMVNLLRVMGSSRWQIIKLVRFPAALPSFFAGLKIAGTYAVMGAIIGEWLGATKGLGVFMTRASYAYQLDKVLAAIIIISLVSLLIFGLIELVARVIMPWYYKERGNN